MGPQFCRMLFAVDFERPCVDATLLQSASIADAVWKDDPSSGRLFSYSILLVAAAAELLQIVYVAVFIVLIPRCFLPFAD